MLPKYLLKKVKSWAKPVNHLLVRQPKPFSNNRQLSEFQLLAVSDGAKQAEISHRARHPSEKLKHSDQTAQQQVQRYSLSTVFTEQLFPI